MTDSFVANELVRVAKILMAYDPLLTSIAKAIEGHSFMSLRRTLEELGIGSVTMATIDMGPSMWIIKSKYGKKIGITPRSQATPDAGDVVVQDKIVGYL